MASEEAPSAVAELSLEVVHLPCTPPKKSKRLTLQERLAAAAKAKRNKAEQSTRNATHMGTERGQVTPNSQLIDPGQKTAVVEDESKNNAGKLSVHSVDRIEEGLDPGRIEEIEPKDLSNDEERLEGTTIEQNSQNTPISIYLEPNNATKDINVDTLKVDQKDGEISRLNKEIGQLQLKLDEQRKEQIQAAQKIPPDRKLAEKDKLLQQSEKKLADKDLTIQQLMEEGQQLSIKELKLNERIRLLVANNTKLESTLRSYAEKNEESLLKLGEIEDLVKVHKLQSVDQLFDVLASSNRKILELQSEIDRQKDSNWEGKYKEIQRLYEKELDEKKECKRQLSEVHVQLELLQNQARLELQSKADIIAQLNREMMSLKNESSTEVLRLEAKIESLRMENENFLKTAHSSSSPVDLDNAEFTMKLVDYMDYLKLSETHQHLQAQYVSSRESWNLIELNLLNKVDALSASVDILMKVKAKNAAEVKKLHVQLNAQLDEIETFQEAVARAAEVKKEQDFRMQMKENECTELEDKLEELRTVFNSDRKNYDVKVKNLTDSIHSLEEQSSSFHPPVSFDNLSSIQGRKGARDSGLHINVDLRQQLARKFSTNSVVSSSMNTPAQPWEDSSYVSEGPDQLMYGTHNASSFSFSEEIYLSEVPEPGETPLSAHVGSFSASGTTKNVQIINKMSASIRHLEAEILSLKEENEQLATEMESAQHKIVKRLELDTKLGALEDHIEVLKHDIDERTHREETLLEVIGEKTEKVGELEADVADLKDLLRQQVQQMIEM